MKICIYGAGAIGGHLALRLARGGAETSVVARGAHLAAIQRNGIVVQTPEGDLQARVRASAEPAELGRAAGSFASIRSTGSSSAGGSSVAAPDIDGGGCVKWATSTAVLESPTNGRCPVKHSWQTIPNE